jgi:hypothetical protein
VTPLSLGIFASANTTVGTSFESIATQTVGSTAVSYVDFTSIPGTYTHLQLRMIVQETRSLYGISEAMLQFNADYTSGNYKSHKLYGDGASATAGVDATTTGAFIGDGTLATNRAPNGTTFGAAIVDILDYTNTNKYTTTRALSGVDLNGTVDSYGGRVGLFSGVWLNTSAITSIRVYPTGGSDFRQYSHFALYGIKSA